METNLSNTLGILVAFATLMLLYSMVVTSLVQATQAVLRLRSRNLWRGLTRILDSERTDNTEDPSSNAFAVLSSSASAVFSVLKKPGLVTRNLLGPDVSWLDSKQLHDALKGSKIGFSPEQMQSIVSKFKQTEKASSKRFQFWTRILTIIWAGFIAVSFQLSTPELLTTLSSDKETRTKLIARGETLAKGSEPKSGSMFYLEPDRIKNFLVYEKTENGTTETIINWGDVAGVIITILLLSLGAPFWFNTLKSVVNLKDALAKDKSDASDSSAPADMDVDQEIKDTTERIAKSDDPIEQAALKAKLGDLRVLKAKMLSV